MSSWSLCLKLRRCTPRKLRIRSSFTIFLLSTMTRKQLLSVAVTTRFMMEFLYCKYTMPPVTTKELVNTRLWKEGPFHFWSGWWSMLPFLCHGIRDYPITNPDLRMLIVLSNTRCSWRATFVLRMHWQSPWLKPSNSHMPKEFPSMTSCLLSPQKVLSSISRTLATSPKRSLLRCLSVSRVFLSTPRITHTETNS